MTRKRPPVAEQICVKCGRPILPGQYASWHTDRKDRLADRHANNCIDPWRPEKP